MLRPFGKLPNLIVLFVYVAESCKASPSLAKLPFENVNSTPCERCCPTLRPSTTPCALSDRYWIWFCVLRKNGVTLSDMSVCGICCSIERS